MSDYEDHQHDLEEEEIEAYCVNCKQKAIIENPSPVWTRRGAPGTRGFCSICGGVIFRMGKTEAHHNLTRPDPGQMLGAPQPGKTGRSVHSRYAAFINYAAADTQVATRLAEDLSRIGIPTWFKDGEEVDGSQWASGVHPALMECSHMVVVLSGSATASEPVRKNWAFFREHRKPVVVAQVGVCDVPDDLRTRPRFDFEQDYKLAFRAMIQALSG